jgi:hypothetical protein
MLYEGYLTTIATAAAFAWPRLGNRWFVRIESAFGRLARRKGLAVASVGISTFLLRLAIIPFCPIPLPFLPDDFSNLLAADIDASKVVWAWDMDAANNRELMQYYPYRAAWLVNMDT